MIDIRTQNELLAVLFTEDGQQVLSAGVEGMIRRWQVNDGHEVGEAIRAEGTEVYSLALSPDRKWLVCGFRLLKLSDGKAMVGVWDTQTQEKVLDVYNHKDTVNSVDISPDSTRVATASYDNITLIWNLTTGQTLVGPLQHDGVVIGVRFSPTGDRIATATSADAPDVKSIRIYDSSNGQQLLDIPFSFATHTSSSLAWSADGRQLFAASSNSEVRRFDTSSGSLLSKWTVPGDGFSTSIVLSHNQKFLAAASAGSLSFWDVSTLTQIGDAIVHTSTIWIIALSPSDDCIATGEQDGALTFYTLHDIIPRSHLTVNLPFMYISHAAFNSWTQGDFTRVEELMTEDIDHPSNPLHHAGALAYRALVRTRSKQWDTAIDDAKKSVQVQRSVVGYIAIAVARVGNGEHELAMPAFDLAFSDGLPGENNLLLLIKAIILFESEKHDEAIVRVGDLIDIVADQTPYITVRAQMQLLLGSMSMRRGDNERAIELFKHAQEAIPFRQGPYLVVISLIFGWDFDRLAPTIQLQLCKAMFAAGHTTIEGSPFTMIETFGEKVLTSDVTDWNSDLIQKWLATFETNGDMAVESQDLKGAIIQYSTALSLNPSNAAGLLVKRSNARAELGLWEDALKDADEAITADASNPWGYVRKHAALHALQRYEEALNAFTRMHSLVEESHDQEIHELGKKYVSPGRSEKAINDIVREIFKICPLVLIDVRSGRLCDGPERLRTFRSELQFKELVSSMTEKLDDARIHREVEEYFQYVTLSHVWETQEPLFQDVNLAGSVWDLDSSSLNEKLVRFCEVVRDDGFRWAWSDTCCIDKTIGTVLNQSLKMMYKWYEASAATFIHLRDVESPSALGYLTESIWMTRAWTAQELLAAKVIRFYDRDWKPYLGDTQSNHKESLEIMQELASAIGIARQTIIAFNPDSLGIREKLRIASRRSATREEDVAYSLIGVFKSDIHPDYGEGEAALGHLLEEIVARSGDVTVLAWNGKSSSYNTCLPSTLAVYSQPPGAVSAIDDADMDGHITALKDSVSQTDALLIYDRIARLPPARFANRRLHLPCIIFAVKRLGIHDSESGKENHYRARVAGMGDVEFQTSDSLSLTEPRRLILVHPWIRDLRDPLDHFIWGTTADDDEYDSDSDPENETSFQVVPATMDSYTRALRLIVRLHQPFHALLLQQEPNGEFKRIAAEHEIVVPGLRHRINSAKDVHAEVVEIL